MGTATLTPILGLLASEFPDVPLTMIKMLVTLPSIEIMMVCLLSGWLATKVSKKKLMFIGLILYAIGGLGGGVVNSYMGLMLFRGIIGLGIGLLIPLVPAIITELFEGNERSRMLGLSSAIATLGGVLATIFSGVLAARSWRYSFLLYLIAIPVFVAVFIGLPDLAKPGEKETDKMDEKVKVKLPKEVFGLATEGIIFTMLNVVLTTSLAMFINAEGMGSSQSAGLAISAIFLGSVITGTLFSKIYKTAKNRSMLLVSILYCVSYWIIGYSNQLILVFMGAILLGFGYGILNPYLLLKAGLAVSQSANTAAMAVISSSFFLGQFMAPIMFGLIGDITGNTESRFGFRIIAILLTVGAAMRIIRTFNSSKKEINEAIVD